METAEVKATKAFFEELQKKESFRKAFQKQFELVNKEEIEEGFLLLTLKSNLFLSSKPHVIEIKERVERDDIEYEFTAYEGEQHINR